MRQQSFYTRNIQTAVGLFVTAAVFINLTADAQLYRETFGRPDPPAGTGNLAPTDWDWIRFRSDGVVNTGNGVNGTDPGNPTDLANTASAGPNNDGSFNAYARGWQFLDGSGAGGLRLSITTEFSLDPALHPEGLIFSWYQGNDYTTTGGPVINDFRLALRVGTSWFVSAATFGNTSVESGAAFGAESVFRSLIYDSTAANWLVLNFDGDYNPETNLGTSSSTALSTGAAPESDLTGIITGFGIYRDNSGANARFDTFQVAVVPEPTSFALLGLGVLGLLFRRRLA